MKHLLFALWFATIAAAFTLQLAMGEDWIVILLLWIALLIILIERLIKN